MQLLIHCTPVFDNDKQKKEKEKKNREEKNKWCAPTCGKHDKTDRRSQWHKPEQMRNATNNARTGWAHKRRNASRLNDENQHTCAKRTEERDSTWRKGR